ncbi:response regulator [Pelagibacterium halotolerans]|uniref:Putative two-component response regulator protein n=1 Tax=Pelagibacterium halotolerans (strain DSM 22347 / JCM 15775 / CGMCC 1.7692 / B2) TaxID=1082931 RepID=G4RCT9_PELHB|nr:response regulator [Pelagibacterium halotolerans]AEQ51744.1 putative two-component response regulator protein [Pelagibacterium halotolerans B2]QJR18439.1 response regulator [Pelagibacterium halotolerans]SEA22064.1 CheY chemotaxis protein or a CheY-like REC (receiver) domain [Pelagibacterium halotolerans]
MSALEHTVADSIAGKCVLVVEDDYVLAREVCNDLKNHGVNVLGPAPTVHYASLIIGRRRLDGAILDIKLFGQEVYELVDVLMARGVPIIFATAYQKDRIDARYRSVDTLHKPLDLGHLRRKVAAFRPQKPAAPIAAPEPVASSRPPDARETTQDRWARLMFDAMRDDA